MPSFEQTKILPYKPYQLFGLVRDVNSYPKFLPWCAASRILSEDGEELIAELVIGTKGFLKSYQSKITKEINDDGVYLINTIAISGPFKYLKSTWQFMPNSAGTELRFFIDFEMGSLILEKLIGNYFIKATEKMISAFEKRAKDTI